MRRTPEIFGKIDGITILLYLVLVFFGWINIYASMHNDDITKSIFDLNTKYGKQLLFIGISLLVGFVILIIDWSFFDCISIYNIEDFANGSSDYTNLRDNNRILKF